MRDHRGKVVLAGALLLGGLSLAGAGAPPAAEDTGTVTGMVRFTGTVPPPKRIETTENSIIIHHDLVVDPKGKGLRYVVAALEDAPAQPPANKAPAVVVDQRDMVFVPRVVAAQHGQTVRFENSDTCNHSVIAHSTVRSNQFNLFVGSNQPYEHAFEAQKPPVLIGCSLHAWMRAWVYVLPHPWFGVTDAQGRFTLERVPPGKYTLWLRHADTGTQERRPVEVRGGKEARVEVQWDRTGP